jgi:hypothetical protein
LSQLDLLSLPPFILFYSLYISLIYDVFLNKDLQYIFDGINSTSAKISWTKAAKGDFRGRFRDQWIQAILLVESFKLVPRPFDEGPRTKSGKLRLNLNGTCFGGKTKKSAQRRAPDLENKESS